MSYENKYKDIIINKYESIEEDKRLTKSRHGQLEFFTTMTYIHKYLKSGMKILEVGAGTGRYSIALAKEGYDVTAVELVEHNLDILRKNSNTINNITSLKGDALDLSVFEDNTFDMVLVFGPMYHLYNQNDQLQAINEAIRVAKPNAKIMFAYLTDGSIILDWGVCGNIKDIKKALKKDFTIQHNPEDIFAPFAIGNFEKLFNNTKTKKVVELSTDSILSLSEQLPDFYVDDDDFEVIKAWHLATCEKVEMHGMSHHMLYICEKI